MSLENKWTKVAFAPQHPFERLLSVFQEKVENSNYSNWRWKLSQFTTSLEEDQPNFEQFVEFVLHMEFPTDPNLRFFWSICGMCQVKYDIIGMHETAQEDNDYIFKKV
jgi:hypothetical protein